MIYLGMIAAIAMADLLLKSGIEALPGETFPRKLPFGMGKAELRKVDNGGFPMGFLKERPLVIRGLSLIAACLVLFRFCILLLKKGNRMQKAGLSMVLGGALSNLFDRFFRRYVVDYLYIDIKPFNCIVFNIGDFFIAFGMLVAFVSELFAGKGKRGKKE